MQKNITEQQEHNGKTDMKRNWTASIIQGKKKPFQNLCKETSHISQELVQSLFYYFLI